MWRVQSALGDNILGWNFVPRGVDSPTCVMASETSVIHRSTVIMKDKNSD